MNKGSNSDDWLQAELADTLDEDIELELSEPALSEEIRKIYKTSHPPTIERAEYFQHLLTLQAELIKLQDWVQHTKAKIVVVFEGRDAAGKGGAIKRITQRLNPRACRVVALPAPTEREKTQWYFQRYTPQLPAGGEIVLFDRSWYNRAGVERVMGFATPEQVEQFFHDVPEFERMARPTLLPIVSIKATRLPSVAPAEVSAHGMQRRQKPVFSLGWTERANRPARRKFADERGRTEYRLFEGIGL